MPFPPRISGRALQAVEHLSRTRAGARLLYRVLRADLRIGQLESLPDGLFGDVPIDTRPLAARPPREGSAELLPLAEPPWCATSETLADAYRTKQTTPREVVDRALAAARRLARRWPGGGGPLTEYVEDDARRDADAATERWRKGTPLSPLDGVPTAIKEQLSVCGLPTRGGSDLLDAKPSSIDAACVARLRAAGAVVLGHTPMTEFGMSPLGFNPKRAMPRNPHVADCLAGGSSTGSAVAVATGLVPFAMGADGGGSIRIPSSLCGVFGIKPTWGRVSRAGNVFGGSVDHIGPIASSVVDLARCLDVVCGQDPLDPQTELAPETPPGWFARALSRGVRGMRIAVVTGEWRDARDAVAERGREALASLESRGAKLVERKLDLAQWAAPIGYLAIGTEAFAMERERLRDGAAYSKDLRITLEALRALHASEYLHAARLRSGLRREMARLFGEVDLVALPTTAATAPRATNAEFEGGFLDAAALDSLCRFTFLANLTGLPALSAPVGLDEARLPVGLQLIGDAWDEATVLAAAAELERADAARVHRPTVTAETA